MIKVIISLLLIVYSFLIANNREQYFLSRLKANLLFKELANKLRENSYTTIRPVCEIINSVLLSSGSNSNTNAENCINSIDIFKENTKNAFGASEFTELLLEYNNATLTDIDEKSKKLTEIADKYYKIAAAEYEKCKNIVYIFYPGIAVIIGIVII